jgi:hypothetical protein
MHSTTIYSAEPSLTEPDNPVSKTGGSEITKTLDETSKIMMVGPDDWRTPLLHYLENLGHIADRKVQRQALKYVTLDNTLYHRTIDDLLLKCLSLDQSKIAMGRLMKIFVVLIN